MRTDMRAADPLLPMNISNAPPRGLTCAAVKSKGGQSGIP
jgi:hypothetical protein